MDLFVARLQQRLREQDMSIALTDAAKVLMSEKGYDPAMGARPLRRAVQREIEDQLSEKILFGEISSGEKITVDVQGEGDEREFTFESIPMTELSDEELEKIQSTPSLLDNDDSQSGKDVPRSPNTGGLGDGPAQAQA